MSRKPEQFPGIRMADLNSNAPKPVVLCILDGWGLNPSPKMNAVAQAATPNFDRLWESAPHATLKTSGEDVGLPPGQMGNSEVGHTNIGAGRVVWMDLPRIDRAIADGEFDANPALRAFIATLKRSGGTAHVMGLLSPGGVHSHQRHIARAARVIAAAGVPVAIHAFLDGRDTPPKSARGYLRDFLDDIAGAPGARLATVTGRFFAMDRDNRWERVADAYRLIVNADGEHADSANHALSDAYTRGESDEFVSPTVIGDYAGAKDGDGVFFANFRADRAREILAALGDPEFDGFDVAGRPEFAALCGMVSYSSRHDGYMSVMYPPDDIRNTLGEWVSAHGKTQFRLAETEKYPHVTFFLNGGVEEPYAGEDRYMAPSPKVKTYDLKPEMSAEEVTDQLVGAIRDRRHDLIVVNYANPDMVGHTGDLKAAIKACEAVDRGLGRALKALDEAGGAVIVTADHGNCEQMADPETGGPHTAHTTLPVPVIVYDGRRANRPTALRDGGRLADLAPTVLALMGLPQPPEMTGVSLFTPDKG